MSRRRAPHANWQSTIRLQRYVLNPPMKAAVWLGQVPGHTIVKTTRRRLPPGRRCPLGARRWRPATALLSLRFDLH